MSGYLLEDNMQDNVIVRYDYKCLKSLQLALDTLWVVWAKARRLAYCLPFVFSLLSFTLLIVRPSYALEAINIDLSAVAQIESSGNPKAIGDGGKALGLFQLHQVVIDEYNSFHNTRFSHQDALDSTISRKIAAWYLNKRIPSMLRHFKKPDNVKNRLLAYNAGINSVVKNRIPPITARYIAKYERLTGAK